MNFKDLTNRRFGRLTVKAFNHFGNNGAYWLCVCDCGREKVVRGSHLTSGNVKSCGCLRREVLDSTTHGLSRSRLYNIWASIKKRCLCLNNKDYNRYGGRGITVCDEWMKFEPFKNWAISNGYDDALTIDRIDNNSDYCPENCRWITSKYQSRNRRNNKTITYNGETHCISEWAEIKGLSHSVISARIKKGWVIEKVLNQPVRQLRKRG